MGAFDKLCCSIYDKQQGLQSVFTQNSTSAFAPAIQFKPVSDFYLVPYLFEWVFLLTNWFTMIILEDLSAITGFWT